MDTDREHLIVNSDPQVNLNRCDNIVNNEDAANEGDQPSKLPQYIATISATLSAVSAGVVLGWTSPISIDIEDGKYNGIVVNDYQMGWIGSFTTLGGFLCSLITGKICDTIGRKSTLILLIIPFGIGWTLILWAHSLSMLYLGRFITGMAAGSCSIAAPLYISEISHISIRGTLGSYFQLMVTVGVLYAYSFGKILSISNYTILCSLMPAVFVLVFVFQPESPVFYFKTNQLVNARLAVKQLRGTHYNNESECIAMIDSLRSTSTSFSNLLNRNVIKALGLTMALMFFQQFGGVNAIIFYTSDIFNQAHVNLDPKLASIIVAIMQVFSTFISSLIVDRAGRRKLLIGSTLVMSISCLLLGVFFTLKDRVKIDQSTINSLGFLPVASLSLYIIAFSLGLGPIPWIIPSELFMSDVKGIATSFVGSFNWLLAFFITKFYLDVEHLIGQDSSFYIFAVISFIGSLFVYFTLPETKGKSSEEIQRLLT